MENKIIEYLAEVQSGYIPDVDEVKKFLSKILKPKIKKKKKLPIKDKAPKTSTRVYDKHQFDDVWSKSGLGGLFVMNLEAQIMENERIIIRPQNGKRVKVMSGGRMGMEPLFGEYVSTGMLDAVVLGTLEDPPIPRIILQVIVKLNTGEGVIIIILNEYCNRLNFLFAAERARKLGIDVQLVLARDDIADRQPEELRYGRRGHTGIVLQYKIAAGMATKGHNLAAISRVTQNIQVATLACHLLGYATYIGPGIRKGLGEYVPALRPGDILNLILKQLVDPVSHNSLGLEPGTNVVILLNKFMINTDEAYSIISATVKLLLGTGAKIARVYQGSFSSFQRRGFSITLLKDWNDELIQFLDLPTTCSLWPPHLSGFVNTKMPKTHLYTRCYLGARNPPENMQVLYDIMDRILRDAKTSIKKLSVINKDVSKEMLKTVSIIRPELDLYSLPLTRPFLLFKYIAKVLRENFKSLGKIFDLFFLAAAQEFLKNEGLIITWRNWCMALKKGTQALHGYTRFKVGEGTVIDFLEPFTEALCETKKGWSPLPFFYGGLEKLKDVMKDRKNDVMFVILDFIFRNIYDCVFEHMSHHKGEDWWKLKPPTTIILVDSSNTNKICYNEIPINLKEKIREKENKQSLYILPGSTISEDWKPERGSEPSLEAMSLGNVDEKCVSLRSADEGLFRQPFLQDRSDLNKTDLKTEFDKATTDNQDGDEENTENDERLSVDDSH